MKELILRTFIRIGLLTLAAVAVVVGFGLIRGWQSTVQFSDGLFWTGTIIFVAGVLNVLGMMNQGIDMRTQYSQSAVKLELEERRKVLDSDMLRSHNLLILLGATGLLLYGLSAILARFGA